MAFADIWSLFKIRDVLERTTIVAGLPVFIEVSPFEFQGQAGVGFSPICSNGNAHGMADHIMFFSIVLVSAFVEVTAKEPPSRMTRIVVDLERSERLRPST